LRPAGKPNMRAVDAVRGRPEVVGARDDTDLLRQVIEGICLETMSKGNRKVMSSGDNSHSAFAKGEQGNVPSNEPRSYLRLPCFFNSLRALGCAHMLAMLPRPQQGKSEAFPSY
jgi:hypothetical protein